MTEKQDLQDVQQTPDAHKINPDLDTQPLVSFAIPVYNMERYLAECLDSILAQPFDDYEIVLVDNNSTDTSRDICAEYASRHSFIRFYSLSGEPIRCRACTFAVRNARGKYIHYIDSDDKLPPNVYAEIESKLRSEQTDIFIGNFNSITEGDILNCVDGDCSPDFVNNSDKNHILNHLTDNMPFHIPYWRFIIKTDLKKKAFEYYVNVQSDVINSMADILQDVVVSMYMLLVAKSVKHLGFPIYIYRERPSSVSKDSGVMQIITCIWVLCDSALIGCKLAKTEPERKFVLAYLEMYTYTLATTLCTLSDVQLYGGMAEIESIREFLCETRKLEPDINKYSPLIFDLFIDVKQDVLNNYRKHCLQVIGQICKKINNKQEGVYIVPTGEFGLVVKTVFELKGVKISGFFDNDKQKDGMIAGGVPIHHPDNVVKIHDNQLLTILIASRYANVRDDLKRQFMALGVDESNLITVVF